MATTKPKRTIYRAVRDVLIAYDETGWPNPEVMEALREAFNAEKVASGIRAQATYDRRLTPEQRVATAARLEARIERLRSADGE